MEEHEPKLESFSAALNLLPAKKTWIKPDVELISSDAIRGGTVMNYTEGIVFGPQSSRTGFISWFISGIDEGK